MLSFRAKSRNLSISGRNKFRPSSVQKLKSAIRNSKMSIYRRVLGYYRPFLWQTIFGLCLALIGIGLNLLKPWPFKIIVDDFLRAGPTIRPDWRMWLLLLCLALIGIQFLWGIINWSTNYLFVKIGLQALLKLRTDLYSYLQSLSLKYHDARRSSDSSFRVAYDSQSIQTIYNKGFTNIFGSVITLIGTFVIMLRLDWQLTLVSLGIGHESVNALPTAGVAHLYGVENGWRHCRRETLLRVTGPAGRHG